MSKSFKIDHDRERRIGFPEIIFGASKTVEALTGIISDFQQKQKSVLVTKLQADKAAELAKIFTPNFYDEISGVLLAGQFPNDAEEGNVAILSGGTSDQYLVNEIYYTLRFLGQKAERFQDVGVAGLHRVVENLDKLRRFKVLIVVAGFEGALPTVVGGLLPQPVIAVPSAVGYGVSEGGHTALNAMLSSCANGITVVNIDNGYGAAMGAYRIIQMMKEDVVNSR